MSIDIFVQRGTGGRPGENVVDPLVASIPVGLQRGRNELDERATAWQKGTLESVYRPGVRRGDLVRNHDLHSGEIWAAMVTGITHTIRKSGDSVQLTTSLRLKRPR